MRPTAIASKMRGRHLIYEGHDQPRGGHLPNPKLVDQLDVLPNGTVLQNGKFYRAALNAKAGQRRPERVRVYEKIKPGIWSYNGIFHLVDAWTERDERRLVFKFRLEAVEGEEDLSLPAPDRPAPRRIIPTPVNSKFGSVTAENASDAAPPTTYTSITTCRFPSAGHR